MGEHVVDLPGDPGPLVEQVRPALLGLQFVALGEQHRRLLGLDPVGAPVAPDHEAGEHDRRQAEQNAVVGAEKGQPADLDRQDASPRHRQGRRQTGFTAGHHRRDEPEGHHGRAAIARAAGEARGDRDQPRGPR